MKNPKSSNKGLMSSMRRFLGHEEMQLAPATSKPLDSARHAHEDGEKGGGRRARPVPKAMPRSVESRGMKDGELGRNLLEAINERMAAGRFVLPQLPATALAVMELTSQAAVEISDVVELVEKDPVLSSELLKVANSVVYAGNVQIESLRHAAMRIGLRTLRSLMMTLSMRGVLLSEESLKAYADEVWSQAHSVATIAKAIGPHVGMDEERAYLVGLLQDIGRIALLAMLGKEIAKKRFAGADVGPSTIGTIFALYHEEAGSLLAKKWKLDDELVAVIGGHHKYDKQEDHAQMAAMASLAHRLDLFFAAPKPEPVELAEGEEPEPEPEAHLPELEYLGIEGAKRDALIHAAFEAYTQHNGTESVEGEDGEAEA